MEDLCGSGSGGYDLRVGGVGNDTTHKEGFGRIPTQGGPQAYWETTLERTEFWMVVSHSGGSDVR